MGSLVKLIYWGDTFIRNGVRTAEWGGGGICWASKWPWLEPSLCPIPRGALECESHHRVGPTLGQVFGLLYYSGIGPWLPCMWMWTSGIESCHCPKGNSLGKGSWVLSSQSSQQLETSTPAQRCRQGTEGVHCKVSVAAVCSESKATVPDVRKTGVTDGTPDQYAHSSWKDSLPVKASWGPGHNSRMSWILELVMRATLGTTSSFWPSPPWGHPGKVHVHKCEHVCVCVHRMQMHMWTMCRAHKGMAFRSIQNVHRTVWGFYCSILAGEMWSCVSLQNTITGFYIVVYFGPTRKDHEG